MGDRLRTLAAIGTLLYCLSLYPGVLSLTRSTGYDAPIYWRNARGERSYEAGGNTWVYSDRVLPAFQAIAWMPYHAFLAVIHIGNSLGVAALVWSALRAARRYPAIGGMCAFVVGAKASDICAGGNITGALCGLSLTPLGALAAAAFKPHYLLAVVLHAAIWAQSRTQDRVAHGRPR